MPPMHQQFQYMSKISSIGSVTDNIESSVNAILSHTNVSLVDQLLPSLRGYVVNSKLSPCYY